MDPVYTCKNKIIFLNLFTFYSNLPPSQGGRYTGFGSAPVATTNNSGMKLLNFGNISKLDTKSFIEETIQVLSKYNHNFVRLGSEFALHFIFSVRKEKHWALSGLSIEDLRNTYPNYA